MPTSTSHFELIVQTCAESLGVKLLNNSQKRPGGEQMSQMQGAHDSNIEISTWTHLDRLCTLLQARDAKEQDKSTTGSEVPPSRRMSTNQSTQELSQSMYPLLNQALRTKSTPEPRRK